MKLPAPNLDGGLTVSAAIFARRTVRRFDRRALGLDHLSQLLWAAQGITGPGGFKRAAPSAGALYPMDVYAVAGFGGIEGLAAGVYHYRPGGHEIEAVADGDRRLPLAAACLHQTWMARAPLDLVITGEVERTAVKYGHRGRRYAHIEAGHIGQNVFLQAVALGLAAGIVGAFQDRLLARELGLPERHEPLLVMPVGAPESS